MDNNSNKCPDCFRVVGKDFIYCPYCRTSIKEKNIPKTLDGVEEIISDPGILTSPHVSTIFNIFRDEAKNDPSRVHLLEEKVYHKFIQNISETEYTVKEMIVIARKVLRIRGLQFSREY